MEFVIQDIDDSYSLPLPTFTYLRNPYDFYFVKIFDSLDPLPVPTLKSDVIKVHIFWEDHKIWTLMDVPLSDFENYFVYFNYERRDNRNIARIVNMRM